MHIVETNISGYRVYLEYDDEFSACFIEKDGVYCGLEGLQYYNCLDYEEGKHRVDKDIVNKIAEWAYNNGY